MRWLHCLHLSDYFDLRILPTIRDHTPLGFMSALACRPELSRMHDLHRQQHVRVLFVLLCIVPAMLICVVACWMHSPAYRDRLANSWELSTGTNVRIAKVCHPRPYVTRIYGLKMMDSVTNSVLLEAESIEVVRTNLGYEIDGNVTVHADLDAVWSIISNRMLKRSWDESIHRLTLRCDRLDWRNDVASQSFRQVRCDFKTARFTDISRNTSWKAIEKEAGVHLQDAPSIQVTFLGQSSVGTNQGGQVEIVQARHASFGHSRTSVTLRTNGNSIQPAIFRPDWFAYVGESRLDCELHVRNDIRGWKGRATNIEWRGLRGHRLVNERFSPLRLGGEYRIYDATAEFTDSYIRSIQGQIECDHGQVSRQFIRRLVDRSGFRINNDPRETISDYQRLHAEFHFDGRDNRVNGKCHVAENQKAVLESRSFKLFPPEGFISINDLISTLLSPNNARSIAAVERLRRVLPLDHIRMVERK